MERYNPLISIVVPVYNVEAYLMECVDSILEQTYANLEIILVDDGSTDKSCDICDRYASLHPNIESLHQENAGMSAARNNGFYHSHGEFIGFVDSDDFISPIFVEALFHAICDSKCLMSAVRHGVSFFGEDKPALSSVTSEAYDYDILSEESYQSELLYQKSWNGAVWRLLHRSILEREPFPDGLYYEDAATAYRFTHNCNKVAILRNENLYAYRQNYRGVMRGSFSSQKARSCILVTRQMYNDISRWYPNLTIAACSRCFAINRVVFSQAAGFKIDRNNLWQELKKYRRSVIRDPKARKREKVAAMISLLGKEPFALFCAIYRFMLRAQ